MAPRLAFAFAVIARTDARRSAETLRDGRMQLVATDIHDETGHAGGFTTWYGE